MRQKLSDPDETVVRKARVETLSASSIFEPMLVTFTFTENLRQ